MNKFCNKIKLLYIIYVSAKNTWWSQQKDYGICSRLKWTRTWQKTAYPSFSHCSFTHWIIQKNADTLFHVIFCKLKKKPDSMYNCWKSVVLKWIDWYYINISPKIFLDKLYYNYVINTTLTYRIHGRGIGRQLSGSMETYSVFMGCLSIQIESVYFHVTRTNGSYPYIAVYLLQMYQTLKE